MSIKTMSTWCFTAIAAMGICPAGLHAQDYQPFAPVDFNPDFQLFAPAELGSFGERPKPAEGYFFTYERLNWNVTGVRTPIGDPNPDRAVRAIDNFPGGLVPAPFIHNSIDESVPRSHYGWGNRYDVGYVVDDHGWQVGILDGPKHFQQETNFGFPNTTNPFGSIAVHFNDPQGQLVSFIDIIDNNVGNPQQGGVDPDGVGDGFADDIDGDGIHGPDGLDSDGDGVPDTILGIATDFDDLVGMPIFFNQMTVRSVTKVNGVELMKVHRLPAFHHGHVMELFYGARYLRIRDSFDVLADTDPTDGIPDGRPLGDSDWRTRTVNNIIGPQLGARVLSKQGRWTVTAQGRFLAGFNIQNLEQTGNLGQILVPGGLNSTQFTSPTSFTHGTRDEHFSPVGELRIAAAFQVTKAVALTVGWTGLYVGEIARASTSVDYTFPNMGLLTDNTQEIFSNGVNFGVEINR